MRLLPATLAIVLSAACATAGGSPPSTFVASTADARVTRMIEVREGIPKPMAMRIVTETLGERYTVEVTDPRAGFVMTAWEASLTRGGVPDLRYRTRIIARFVGDDWHQLQVRDEANWARGDEWDIGMDEPQLDSITTVLRTKLGKKP